jgi:hypothetical protein
LAGGYRTARKLEAHPLKQSSKQVDFLHSALVGSKKQLLRHGIATFKGRFQVRCKDLLGWTFQRKFSVPKILAEAVA